MKYLLVSFVLLFSFILMLSRIAGEERGLRTEVKMVKVPPASGANSHYVSNRPLLLPSLLVKLPIGSIEPKGWLLSQLQLMRDGFTGRLAELSKFLKEDSGWLTLKGGGWEEMPYWLKGYGDLGYVLKDADIISRAKKWLEAALVSQQPDGYFGPPDSKEKHDLWPNMVMLFALQSFYEATGDARVVSFMTSYFHYELNLPDEHLLPGSWQKLRGGDNLESIYWLYNRTCEKFLLDLGQRIFERTFDWTSPILSPERDKSWEVSSFYHGVNITMGIRQPGVYYQQSRDKKHIEAVEKNYSLLFNQKPLQ